LDFYPSYVDCGGGLPVPGEWNSENPELTQTELGHLLRDMRNILGEIGYLFPTAKEIWMENGRFLTARSAVLVVRVIDVKERPECRYLICNGGRTNHALISDWEHHHIFSFPPRGGASRLTTICGPTCMAFDRLIRMPLPSDVQIGDFLVWMNAGAYHIPWETRFSNGLAQVIWCDENMKLSLARKSEVFEEWWGKWVD
jgi:diaminopimelate decarboxylase